MTTINAKAIANSHLDGEIDKRRGHAARSYFKRQSRRQVRHRLKADLQAQMAHHLADAMVKSTTQAPATAHVSGVPIASATIIAFPSTAQRAARQVEVIRKLSRTPFERQQYEVTVLAA